MPINQETSYTTASSDRKAPEGISSVTPTDSEDKPRSVTPKKSKLFKKKSASTKSTPDLKASVVRTDGDSIKAAHVFLRSQPPPLPAAPRTPRTATTNTPTDHAFLRSQSPHPPAVPRTPHTATTNTPTEYSMVPESTIYFTVDPAWDTSKGDTAELYFIPRPGAPVGSRRVEPPF